ncbi:PaaI family thioesterase [Rubrivirga sp.]|uniref:PaaI family thioesterase n=1 Tax=Rubrivirga sp. TaxID=1885344 RepID=UPI003B52E00D
MSVPTKEELQGLADAMKSLGAGDLRLPPPVLEEMEAEIRDYRPAGGDGVGAAMVAWFPVLERYQNPMGLMQGGMVAAAVDNVVGPLSYLVAPPSVTAQLTMTYLAPVTPDLDHVEVEARLVARSGRQLVFDATVSAPDGRALAVARSTNTIVRKGAGG